MRIYLITHAHTEQIPHVATDAWQLSARGLQQAAELTKAPFWAEVDRVVVSSERKTWLTVADVVRERKLPVWVDCRFDELRRSGWIEDYAAQVAKVFAQPTQSVIGWEPAISAQRRAELGLADLQRRFWGETLALVGHGISLSLVRAGLLGLSRVDHEVWQRLSFGTCALASLAPPVIIQDFVQSMNTVR
jgi:broad specificity phosphatase PhoE